VARPFFAANEASTEKVRVRVADIVEKSALLGFFSYSDGGADGTVGKLSVMRVAIFPSNNLDPSK
jgi:hypothetical protein